MIIDIHQHITCSRLPQLAEVRGCGPFSARHLLEDMDKWGIDRSVVLPLANPENADVFGVAGNHEVITQCARHTDRLIPFCNIDPRAVFNTPKADLGMFIRAYKDLGCRGVGELCANLPVTSPLYRNVFDHAGREQMPVLFHLSGKRGGTYGMVDKPGLPGLEQALMDFPKTLFIGHAPAFWNEIDGNLKPYARDGYVTGPVETDGELWRLMTTYPNLYADISAGSGHNALTRDPPTGVRFIQQFHKKLFFGTDLFFVKSEPPPHLILMQEALRKKDITRSMFNNVMHHNFERVFGK